MAFGFGAFFAGASLPYTCTIGTLGSPFFFAGYASDLGTWTGPPSLSAPVTVNGEELLSIYGGYGAGGPDFVVRLDDDDSNGAITDFTSIIVEDGDGVLRTYNTADATFSTAAPGVAKWSWGNGSDEVWGNVDLGEVRGFAFIV